MEERHAKLLKKQLILPGTSPPNISLSLQGTDEVITLRPGGGRSAQSPLALVATLIE